MRLSDKIAKLAHFAIVPTGEKMLESKMHNLQPGDKARVVMPGMHEDFEGKNETGKFVCNLTIGQIVTVSPQEAQTWDAETLEDCPQIAIEATDTEGVVRTIFVDTQDVAPAASS